MASNPYAPPQAALTADAVVADGLWRDGQQIVARIDCRFPERCLKCNAPVRADDMKRRRFRWHAGWVYVFLLLGVFTYFIAAIFTMHKSIHHLGLCARHRARRRIFIAIGWSWLPLLLIAPAVFGEVGVTIALILTPILILTGMYGARIMTPRRMDERHVHYQGCGPAFIASLPTSPPHMRR